MSFRTRRLTRSAQALLAAASLATACGLAATPASAATAPHHVLAYYQTQYSNGTYVSPLPLQGIATDVEVAAFHLNTGGTITLNNDAPSSSIYTQMWSDLAAMQAKGTKVEALLGGAAQGSYADLHSDFATYYPVLRDTLRTYHLDGVDLDIEETFSLADTEKLIKQLRTDFGSGFLITLTPVATDLSGTSSYSGGFSYKQLEQDLGSSISWYTGQFYCGWGSLGSTADYDQVVANGFSPSRVVAGTVTNSANCSGYVQPSQLASTLKSLTGKYPTFAGAAGWEYFNATPVSTYGTGPASWYQNAADAMSGTAAKSGPITSGITGKCADDSSQNTADGTPIQLWDCNGTAAQQFTVNADGSLGVMGKCMDVTHSGTADGTKVQLWDCNGTGAQVWQQTSNGSLLNPQSGRCLDDPQSSTTNGTQLQIWDCNGTAAQVWKLP
ncbi:ricin-type beta-trefoil lectin domain protein [Streptacidiphilus monticola]|uniref:chitinase n=1 Tax=Streptacidiphilus monticola TaxID=2161674 RepID=A0ABW1G778_9ACTN